MSMSFIIEASRDVVTKEGMFRVTRTVNVPEGEALFAAYEPVINLERHTSFKKDDTGWWGNVSDRKLPRELDERYGGSLERTHAVGDYYRANRKLAHSLIVEAFPEAEKGMQVMGAIVLTLRKQRWGMLY